MDDFDDGGIQEPSADFPAPDEPPGRNGHDRRFEEARAVRIEDELASRGIALRGRGSERCGPCPRCGGTDRFSIDTKKQVELSRVRGQRPRGDRSLMFFDGSDFVGAVETLAGSPRQAPARARERAQQPKKLYFPYTDEAGIPLSREVRLQYADGRKQPGRRRRTRTGLENGSPARVAWPACAACLLS
jgi:hypothetical protein